MQYDDKQVPSSSSDCESSTDDWTSSLQITARAAGMVRNDRFCNKNSVSTGEEHEWELQI